MHDFSDRVPCVRVCMPIDSHVYGPPSWGESARWVAGGGYLDCEHRISLVMRGGSFTPVIPEKRTALFTDESH